MKNKLALFIASLLLLGGCDKIKDATTIPVSTHLQTNIPVVVAAVGMKSFDLIAVGTGITFSKSHDLALESNTDISPYISRVKSINLNSVLVTITGLSAGQTINMLTFDVAGVGNIFTLANITMTNNSFTPVIAAGILDQVAAKLTTDRKITLSVAGTASGAMTFTVGLNIDTTVTVYTIN
jgi:hypothetical protein